MSVGTFRNVTTSLNPFRWTIFEEAEGRIKIKSQQDNLFVELVNNRIVLVPDSNSERQKWTREDIGGGNVVLRNVAETNRAIGIDESNRVVAAIFTNVNDRGTPFKGFSLQQI